MTIRKYPDYLFRDPLLMPTYLVNEQAGTPITLTDVIDINVDGDDFLQLYIDVLDEEIFSEMPEGLNPLAQAFWESDHLKDLFIKMLNESRKHAWCVIQFYDDESNERWRVFSVQQFTDYIKESYKNEEGIEKLKMVGMKFEWGDYLGNTFTEEVRFDDKNTHLIKFREGNGMSVFAFPDLSQAIMTIAFGIRQILGEYTFSASKASFKHFVYGDAADNDSVDILDTKLKGINSSAGIGAPEKVLKQILTIKNENIAIIDPALDKLIGLFAGATRLPISFYMGEKESQGISDVGVKMDKLQVLNKKNYLFKLFEPYIKQIFDEVYGITLNELNLPQEITLEDVEEDKDEDKDNKEDKSLKKEDKKDIPRFKKEKEDK